MAKRNSKQPSRRAIARDRSVRGRITDLLEGRATPAELIAAGVLIDLTTGPTAKVWSDVYPGGTPTFVTKGVGDIVQRAVHHPESRTDLDTVVYDLLWMSRPSPRALRPLAEVVLTGEPVPYLDETCDEEFDTHVMHLRRRYLKDLVFVCWIPTNPKSEFGDVADSHIFRMALGPQAGDVRPFIIMTPDGDRAGVRLIGLRGVPTGTPSSMVQLGRVGSPAPLDPL